MSKLLRANFSRLFHSLFFYITMIVSAALAVLFPVMNTAFTNSTNMPDGQGATDLFAVAGLGMLFLPFIAAIIFALFIDPEYTHGTLRNKLVCGHSRSAIYFAAFITGAAAVTIAFALFMTIYLTLAPHLGIGGLRSSVGDAAKVLVVWYIQLLAVSALSNLLCTTIHGVKCVVFALGVQYGLTAIGLVPSLLISEERKAFHIRLIGYLLPQSASFQLPQCIDHATVALPDDLYLYFLCPAAACVLLLAVGLIAMKKTDLK